MLGINPKDMEKMMKQLGVKQEPIDAIEVIIKTKDKDLIIRNPNVNKVKAMGQETIQVIGEIEEVENNQEDIETIIEQTGVDEETARKALKKSNGDLAKAILGLKK